MQLMRTIMVESLRVKHSGGANCASHAAPHTGEHNFGVGICGDRRVVLRSRMQRGPVPYRVCACR